MPDEQDELERLRHKKMAQIMKRIEQEKKKEENQQKKSEKTENFLLRVMLPDALEYYNTQILSRHPLIANRIVEVLQNLISSGILTRKLNKDEIILIHRKLSGIGPSIKIKRSGKEYTDIASELTGKK